jgi:cytochrome c oxidase cbb3-type subunit III
MMRTAHLFRISLTTVLTSLASLAAMAQDNTTPVKMGYIGDQHTVITVILVILLLIILALVYLLKQTTVLLREAHKGMAGAKAGAGVWDWWHRLDKKLFTKAVAVDKEADVLLDHDYDGIRELDNALPPWWKWGFYITLVIGVIYLWRFHVSGSGLNPEQEYQEEMTVAAAKLEGSRKSAGETVDEKTVTLADKAGIEAGKKAYNINCITCHGSLGEGGTGPNLTDAYWLHGGSINEVFKTIKYGVAEKGMQSWQKVLSPSQIKNVSSYIMSLGGTQPPNPKAPQGTLYQPAKDSVAVKKDSVAAPVAAKK